MSHIATVRHRAAPRRCLAIVTATTCFVIGLCSPTGASHPAKGHPHRHHTPSPPPAAAEAGLLPWSLGAPLSREVVMAQPNSTVLKIYGGLEGSGASGAGVYSLDVSNGSAALVGGLAQPTHDAAGVLLGRSAIVLGGGTATAVATAQRVDNGQNGVIAGTLPHARADAAAVAIGRTAYVIGGYDGRTLDPEVLATTDGHSFRPFARLAVPVRYPAVAVLKGRIYVCGGLNASGTPVATVQIVDPSKSTVSLAKPLPAATAGAAAGVAGGTLYLAGGLTAGQSGGTAAPSYAIDAFDPAHGTFLRAGTLPIAVSNAGTAVTGGRLYIVGGETAGGTPTADVQMLTPNRGFGTAGMAGAGSPYFGDQLLVADRGNNRLLLLDDTGNIVWTYPSPTEPAPPGGFYFPDDAFFARHGSAIVVNQEENDTVVLLAYPSGRVLFSYGHPRNPGSSPGYLNNPDDAYVMRNGNVSVADVMNCRILILSPQTGAIVSQIGQTGQCVHRPPSGLGSPNGDTPLSDGNLLVSEITGNWVDEYGPGGQLVWQVRLPSVAYVSDPQQVGPNRYLVSDYSKPGALVEFNQQGQILYRYAPSSGPGELDHPSLAEVLPSGALMANDDYNDRMVAIDPATGALVWQYGTRGSPGTTPGLLNIPDGFDIVGPGGVTPTHPGTG